MNPFLRIRLSVLMLLQYIVWGAWYVPMYPYLSKTLGFPGDKINTAYSCTAFAAMASPFFVGMIADRFFASQRVLGSLHLLGAALLYLAAQQTEFGPFFSLLLGHTLCYMPTMSLSNSLSMAQMRDPATEFPSIRVLGTIGWILAGLLVGGLQMTLDGALTYQLKLGPWILGAQGAFQSIEPTRLPMLIGAGTALILGIYCFFLPHTPPPNKGTTAEWRVVLGLDALKLFRDKSFAVFAAGSFLICVPLTFYYNLANGYLNELGVENAAFKMTFGQMSEIFFMLLMPFCFRRLGIRTLLLLGMAAWTARYFLFSFGNNGPLFGMILLGILLHGVCYDFFFVTGQIYVDRQAEAGCRGQAQGLISFLTYGAGMFFGSFVAGRVDRALTLPQGGHDWQKLWMFPALGAAGLLLVFALTFKEPPTARSN